MCTPLSSSAKDEIKSCKEAFEIAYQREFGFILPGRNIIVDDLRSVLVEFYTFLEVFFLFYAFLLMCE